MGAEAVELPAGTPALPEVDGLLLPGGWDVDPSLYGEEPDPKVGPVDRELDDTELRLFAQARDGGLSVMGVCRGLEVINEGIWSIYFNRVLRARLDERDYVIRD